MLTIDHLDHIVLTVTDIDATISFYSRVLGMAAVTFGAGRRGLAFGPQKINLHRAGHEFSPCARQPCAGSADFCLITKMPLDAASNPTSRLVSILGLYRSAGPGLAEAMRVGGIMPQSTGRLRELACPRALVPDELLRSWRRFRH